MGRKILKLNEYTTMVHGNDHTLGYFVDIVDNRYANSDLDEQGEGYLVEWSSEFNFSNNIIDLKFDDFKDPQKIIDKVNYFLYMNHITDG